MRNTFNTVARVATTGTIIGLSLPVLLPISAAVYCDVGGPLFKEKRFGKDGKPFTLYKFKTMRDPENEREISQNFDSDRVTKVGQFLRKTRLDELPQLFNILKGDMTLIGHRAQPNKDAYRDVMKKFPVLWNNKPGLFSPKQTDPKHWRVTVNQPDFEQRFSEACDVDSNGLQDMTKTQKLTLPFKVIATMLTCESTGSVDFNEPEKKPETKPRFQQ